MSRPTRPKQVRFDHWGYIFVAPFLIAFLAFQVYPIFNTFFLGFTNMKGTSTEFEMIGFSNFIKSNYTIELNGKSAEDANRIVNALNALNNPAIYAETDAPAPASANADPFSLDSATETKAVATPAPAASADPYALDAATDAAVSTGYFIKVSRLSGNSELSLVKDTLVNAGISADVVTAAVTTTLGGLLFDGFFWKAFWNTCILWFFNFIPQLGFALLFAVWFTDVQLKMRLTGLFKTVYYMPNIIMPASVALLFASIFGHPNGPVNLFLVQQLSIPDGVNFFRSEIWTRGIVSFIQFWMWYGTTLVVLIAGIVGIPESLYESAVVDGANSRQMFTKITLPLLRPVMNYTLVTSLIGGMNMFEIPFLLTNRRGSPGDSINTTFMYIYNTAFGSNNNYSYASAISIGLFILVLILALVVFYLMRDKDEIAARKMRRLAK